MNEILFKLAEYGKKGYCCSQIIPLLEFEALEVEEENILKVLAPFCFGFYKGGLGLCGSVIGSLALLGYYGHGIDDQQLHGWKAEFFKWFEENYAPTGLTCQNVLQGKNPNISSCGQMIASCYQKCVEILFEAGLR